ncbi:PspC domain-containing protein [Saccharothrix sp. S26]|uniref:PspC domain-containing protein n=1 Tax=Saccharothrix sp. S26 TaxID=2907215 RepID=UPI001F4253C9|nr:PspC domain-containing protein [Saccharothrix sp. S26]MCE6994152.1 PspC domain-containing protein [Saccharothrix sp. S26]
MTNDVLDQATAKVKKLRRSRTDKMVAGVCGGAAEMLGVDAALLRILLVAATLFGVGAGAVLYLAAWILVPEAD